MDTPATKMTEQAMRRECKRLRGQLADRAKRYPDGHCWDDADRRRIAVLEAEISSRAAARKSYRNIR